MSQSLSHDEIHRLLFTAYSTPLGQDRDRFEKALILTDGNITYAAVVLGVTREYCMVLLRRFRMKMFAHELRTKNGQKSRGRPRKRAPEPALAVRESPREVAA